MIYKPSAAEGKQFQLSGDMAALKEAIEYGGNFINQLSLYDFGTNLYHAAASCESEWEDDGVRYAYIEFANRSGEVFIDFAANTIAWVTN